MVNFSYIPVPQLQYSDVIIQMGVSRSVVHLKGTEQKEWPPKQQTRQNQGQTLHPQYRIRQGQSQTSTHNQHSQYHSITVIH